MTQHSDDNGEQTTPPETRPQADLATLDRLVGPGRCRAKPEER